MVLNPQSDNDIIGKIVLSDKEALGGMCPSKAIPPTNASAICVKRKNSYAILRTRYRDKGRISASADAA